MRIIITKEGNEIINDLSKSLNHNNNSYNPLIQNQIILNENNYSSLNIKFPELLRSSSTPSINYNNNSKLISSQNQKKTDDSSNLSQINLNENRNKLKVKLLKLNLNKVKIPENQTNLYLQDKLTESSIINEKRPIKVTRSVLTVNAKNAVNNIAIIDNILRDGNECKNKYPVNIPSIVYIKNFIKLFPKCLDTLYQI